MSSAQEFDQSGLLGAIDGSFSDEELRTLCFELGVDYDNLPAKGKNNKARELVALCDRRDCIHDLLELCQAVRPKVDWLSFARDVGAINDDPTLETGAGRQVKVPSIIWISIAVITIGLVTTAIIIALSIAAPNEEGTIRQANLLMKPSQPNHDSTPIIIDGMNNVSGWIDWNAPSAIVNLRSIPGKIDNAIEVSYSLTPGNGDAVLISRNIDPEILSGTKGVEFYSWGSGETNAIELKLLYAAAEDTGQSITFAYLLPNATVSEDWTIHEVLYEDSRLECGPCPDDGKLDLAQVRTINFAISNRDGGASGTGTVAFDEVVGIK